MATLTVDFPEALSAELDSVVEAGWFTSHVEAVRAAVRDSMNHRKLAMPEDADKMVGGWMRKGRGNDGNAG